MNLQSVLIVGAGSSIATETAREFARRGASLVVTARNQQQLDDIIADLRVHQARKVEGFVYDATRDYLTVDPVAHAATLVENLDAVLIAYGTLPNTRECLEHVERAVDAMTVNATSLIVLCIRAYRYFVSRDDLPRRCIAVITSVAGDRGRQSNFIYGSAKSAVSTFLQGLRNLLYEHNIQVLTVKPGMVDTPMTAHLAKNPLFSSASRVGRAIFQAMQKGRDVVYIPWFWRYIMFIIKIIPESIFKSMKL